MEWPHFILQAPSFTLTLISLVGIKSAVGESGPLKETNKSRQVLERDPRKSGLVCIWTGQISHGTFLHALATPLEY